MKTWCVLGLVGLCVGVGVECCVWVLSVVCECECCVWVLRIL